MPQTQQLVLIKQTNYFRLWAAIVYTHHRRFKYTYFSECVNKCVFCTRDALWMFFSKALLTSTLLLVSVYPDVDVDLDVGIFYTMQHRAVSQPTSRLYAVELAVFLCLRYAV